MEDNLTEKLTENSKNLNFLFYNKVKYNFTKLDNPRDIDLFHKILNAVYDVPMTSPVLNKKYLNSLYDEYTSFFDVFDFKHKHILGKRVFSLFSNINTSIDFYIHRCYTLKYAKLKLKERQSTFSKKAFIKRHGITLGTIKFDRAIAQGLRTLKSRDDYDIICKSKGNSNRFEFYLEKINDNTGNYFTIKEAKDLINKKQSQASLKRWEYYKNGLSNYVPNTCLDFYLQKGMSTTDAILALHERQSVTSLKSYIQRYGEDRGKFKYDSRIFKWKKIMNGKSDAEKKSIRLKQIKSLSFQSKESTDFFNNIIVELGKIGIKFDDVYFGKKEYLIYDNIKGRVFFYDFTIPSIKYSCEYNGHKFHADPRVPIYEQEKWQSLFSNKTYKESLEFDSYKNSLMTDLDYHLDIVWDFESIECKTNRVINNIKIKIV